MPKRTALVNQHIAVQKGQELDPQPGDGGEPVVHEVFTLIFTDKTYQDQITITFGKEARDDIVKQLMGGLIIPGL